MKRKILFYLLACGILLAGIPVYGQSSSFEGTWIIDNVVVTTTIDNGNPITKAYITPENLHHFVSVPQKVSFTTDSAFLYMEAYTGRGTYTKEGNTLHILMPEAPYVYQYSLSISGKLRLDYSTHYVRDGIKKVEETYQFYGHRE
ncbi:hypothetical protein FACS189411_15690 [Bacteroidia bacterium]|nr:hypothetical protein FACS189411_15690 [Bacteroidia bacterium]